MKSLIQRDKQMNYNVTKSVAAICGGVCLGLLISPPIGVILTVSGLGASVVDNMYQGVKKIRSSH